MMFFIKAFLLWLSSVAALWVLLPATAVVLVVYSFSWVMQWITSNS